MTLPITSSAPAPSRVGGDHADACALVCAASAGVHGALVAPHAAESTRMAVGFTVATVALALAALGLAVAPGSAVSTAAAALLAAVATAYLLSRTSGIPGLTEHPEPFDPLGVAISLLEAAAAVVAVRHPNPWRQ